MCGETAKTVGLIEGRTARIEQQIRRMIDVDQDRVEPAPRCVRVEACL